MNDIDTRQFSHSTDPGRAARDHPAHKHAELDPFTGTPSRIRFERPKPNLVSEALRLVGEMADCHLRTGDVAPDFVPDPRVHRISSAAQLVHLYQHHQGIPVFETVRTVLFDPNGRPLEISGSHVPVPRDADPEPSVEPADALLALLENIRPELGADCPLKITSSAPRVVASFPLPTRPSAMTKPPFEGLITAHLVFFYRGHDMPLGWFIRMRAPTPIYSVQAIIGASGEEARSVLYQATATAAAKGLGFVHLNNPGAGDRTRRPFPEGLDGLPRQRPADLPVGFPFDWIGSRRTLGNNVDARRKNKSLEGTIAAGDVLFEPAEAQGNPQRILDAFYFCNLLHDFFYLLGFDETERNFQASNLTGAPGAGDEMEVRVFSSSFPGLASIDTDVDGRNCRISLGPVPPRNRHTALDADVVMHEYTHGVTARLIGGDHLWRPLLGPPQARALDEGYCDYFALSFQNYRRAASLIAEGASDELATLDRSLVFGAWVADDPARGLRRHAYGSEFPVTFGEIPTPDFNAHDRGQIWCEALLRLNRKLGKVLQDRLQGDELGWQLVVDSMKLLPVNTNSIGFLEARNRIFQAIELMALVSPGLATGGPLFPADLHGGVLQAAREAFAELGMGAAAASQSAGLEGILEDFTTSNQP